MKMTKDQIDEYIDNFSFSEDSFEVDNDGQLVIYFGMYRWADGSIHDCSESDGEDDGERVSDSGLN